MDEVIEMLPSGWISATTTSPFLTSRTKRAPMMSRAQVSEAKIGLPSRSPSTSGRMPLGSRAPISLVRVMATIAKAPSTWASASVKRSSEPLRRLLAIRWSTTSVSEVDCMIAPVEISSRRTVRPLVKLPLWAMAMPPTSSSANSGCTLRRIVSPVVE